MSESSSYELMVTIRCLVYNHESYLRQCLDGFVMQKTNFRFEAIVHDDASTDGSASIIQEYAEKYPEIIKPIYETDNQYSKHDGSLRRIMDAQIRGKYVAMCEGDDYWNDPLKLQKQVDFLEAHSDYSLCFHNAMVHYEASDRPDESFAQITSREFSRDEVITSWVAPTASFLFRKVVIDSELYKKCFSSGKLLAGDLPLLLVASFQGKLYGLSETMSVYRKHPAGMMKSWSSKSYEFCLYYIQLEKIFGECIHKSIQKRVAENGIRALKLIFKGLPKKGIKGLWLSLKFAPVETILRFCEQINKKIFSHDKD